MTQTLIFIVSLLAAFTAAQQSTCTDIPRSTTFPCEFEVELGRCEPPLDRFLKVDGQLVYCLKSCGLCDKVNLNTLPTNIQSKDEVQEVVDSSGNFAVGEGVSRSYQELVTSIQSNFTYAIASLNETSTNTQQDVVAAAISTTRAVATAIASAMSEVSIRGATNSESSVVTGVAEAEASAVANATASAYSVAIAEAGSEFTELESSALVSDVQTALTNTAVDLSISGETQASVQQQAYVSVAAEAVANTTAQAFARITGNEAAAIALAVAQAFNTSQLQCLSFCNNQPPTDDKVCSEYVENNECNSIIGYCECACGTCFIGSEASISTVANIISNSNSQQIVNAMGEAFAQGAKGADALAQAFVQAVAQGDSESVSNAIAEAFGAQEISAKALAQAVTAAINQGGDGVTSAVADAFAVAERGGNAESLAEAIASVMSLDDVGNESTKAMLDALDTAIQKNGCESVGTALAEAEAIADGQGKGPAFASAAALSETVNKCLQSLDDSTSDITAYVQSITYGNTAASAEAGAQTVVDGEVLSSIDAISQAISEGRSQAIATGLGTALGQGVPTTAVVESIAVAINDGSEESVVAVADAFAQAENSYADALANVFAVAILDGGDSAEAIASAMSMAVSQNGCSAIANSLAMAQAAAESQGKGQVFANLLPGLVAECLGVNIATAEIVAQALIDGDETAALTLAAQAFAEQNFDDLVQGIEQARNQGSDCVTINDFLSKISSMEGSKGLGQAVSKFDSITTCIGTGYSQCSFTVKRDCCTASHPLECRCFGRSCRAKLNEEASLPELGLYVYRDIGNRDCRCEVNF
eukprot:TRINITY_DN1916_c0_g1_i5.p1 TRINITY_DN1916_c0_g1~~TRINITY_DN1916_c0_g1_i5.p1  ORF type:complete len:856 (+),score=170.81 TRINITY_DN1916_c0_g1_i5:106-2568(+)